MIFFISINFDAQKDNFNNTITSLKQIHGLKASYPKSFHITLKFLGDIDNKKLDLVKNSLRQIEHEKFHIKFSSIGFFPAKKNPRVIWQGIDKSTEILDLHSQIIKVLGEKDYQFVPHITLARIKRIDDRKFFFEKIEEIEKKLVTKEVINIDLFRLMKSTRTPEGAIHEDEEVYNLR